MITIICPCGRTISTTPFRARRKRYCSKKCFYKYRPVGLNIGKKYNITKVNPTSFKKGHISWNLGTKGIHLSVGSEIKKGQRIGIKTEFKKGEHKRENNIKWNGGISSYRRWAVENKEKLICEECGYKKNKRLVHIHHIDGNRKNNNKNNLIILCIWCHLSKHRQNYQKRSA